MKMAKEKIVWLCSFTNSFKRSKLKLWWERERESKPFIPILLSAISRMSKYEFHVISTETYLRERYSYYNSDGIHYHCFQSGMPLIGKAMASINTD